MYGRLYMISIELTAQTKLVSGVENCLTGAQSVAKGKGVFLLILLLAGLTYLIYNTMYTYTRQKIN